MVEAERLRQIQTLFSQAAELPAEEQHNFLRVACGGDNTLLTDLLVMLDEDQRDGSMLDRDLASLAQNLFRNIGLDLERLRNVGPYRIKSVLGEGGMGAVFLAERVDLGNLVAVKILRDVLSPIRLQRFQTEQRILAQLTHPSIGRLYDADILPDGTPYFAMEYIDGLALTEFCSRHQSDLHTRLNLFREICNAVQYAHAHALIHRDLKPSNILVRPDGSISLIDFGIAKELQTSDPVNETGTGLRLMTPAYAAPEQLRGGHAGIRTDVYSLGVILYELLTGQLPFDLSDRTPGEMEAAVLHQEPRKPSAVIKEKNGFAKGGDHYGNFATADWDDLDVLCLVAMHKEPERRYQSVEALIRDVDNYQQGKPLEARPDSVVYRTRKFLSRNLKPVLAAAAIVITALALTVFFIVRLKDAKNEALAQAARSERIKDFMTGLFEGGAEAGPSLDLRAVDVLNGGVQAAGKLSADPKTQADLYQTLSESYVALGKFDQAAPLAQSALQIRAAQYGRNSAPVAESLVTLGGIRAEQAKFPEAIPLIKEGMAIDEKLFKPTDFRVGRDCFYLGRALAQNRESKVALDVLTRAVGILSQPGAPQENLLFSLDSLSTTNFNLGNFSLAESLSKRALAIARRIYAPSNPLIAEELMNIGSIRFQQQRFDEAGRYYGDALQSIRKWYGEDSAFYASAAAFLGQVRVKQKRYPEAQALLRQAVALHEKYYGKVSIFVGTDLNALGVLEENMNQWDEAEADLNRVVTIDTALSPANQHPFLLALHNLSDLNRQRNHLALAEKQSRTALSQADASLPPTHFYAAIIRMGLGKVLVAEKRYREAEPYLIESCSILEKQGSPTSPLLVKARNLLAADRLAIGKSR
jgi:serine/threonine protein kinase